ncbi:hypothetical protein ACQEVY_00275 [Streptomyces sp. CA-288835]|uniref:hypothetical protein n=1 Tax=Streptomyces sp. CA-288835 TaxID=3240069 RepID=UPI003D8D49E8
MQRYWDVEDVRQVRSDQSVWPAARAAPPASRWAAGDHDVLVTFDAGYDAPRMAHLLASPA